VKPSPPKKTPGSVCHLCHRTIKPMSGRPPVGTHRRGALSRSRSQEKTPGSVCHLCQTENETGCAGHHSKRKNVDNSSSDARKQKTRVSDQKHGTAECTRHASKGNHQD